MKNIFIITSLFLLGSFVSISFAGYFVQQNRLTEESARKEYVASLESMKASLAQEKKNIQKDTRLTIKPAAVTKPVAVNVPSPVKTVSPPVSPTKSTALTAASVSGHNTSSDCWIIITGNVYSVTSYISMHPGGSKKIINVCGQDATAAFENIQGGRGHSGYANSLLNQYLVGTL